MEIFILSLFTMLVITLVCLLILINKIRREGELDKLTDAETGMGNLQFFKQHFQMLSTDTNKYTLAYIVLDSSYLRSYHGESSFEDVLRYTSSVIKEHTGCNEISARITENGFAFSFCSSSKEESQMRLEKIIRDLNTFDNAKKKNTVPVFYCAFCTLAHTDKNCEILLFNLRKNCNRIYGKNNQIVYCDTHAMNMVRDEKKFTESIIKGLENEEFKMYLQFIVDNKTKKITSCEALSRWDSSENGFLNPGSYMADIEEANLISKHDFYMLDLACRQLEKWSNTKYDDISISCNFTRITLSENDFIDNFTAVCQKYNFDRKKLAIEITEDAIEKNRETAIKNVILCKKLGFRIYLDDLGSGYTTLANLCDYPIDVVKLDRDILLKTDTKKGKDLFAGIIALAHSLDIQVVCEGVETDEQNDFVTESDCDYIQGWYYSKPMPHTEYEAFLENIELFR